MEHKETVLITGGSSGIGFAFAKIFAAKHYHVVLVAKDATGLTKAQEHLQIQYKGEVTAIPADLSVTGSAESLCHSLTERKIQVDILINNAGFATHGLFSEIPLQNEIAEIQVNITTLTILTKLFARKMIARKRGKILFVASTAAFLPGPLMAVYYATKAYVLSFSQALSEELAPFGITVTALCPGPTQTGFAKRAGVEHTKFFSGSLSDAETVAQKGYEGLLKGKRLVIPGSNAFLIACIPFVPTWFLLKYIRYFQT